MKLLNYLVLLVSVSFLLCCGKEEKEVIIYEAGNQEFGWATGTKEGAQWEASGYWQYHLNDSTLTSIKFVTYNSEGVQREKISIGYIPLSEGTLSIKRNPDVNNGIARGSYSMSDGDVSLGGLEVNENENSYITISQIDSLTNTIKGFFEVYFISESGGLKVEIKDGEFEVRPYE